METNLLLFLSDSLSLLLLLQLETNLPTRWPTVMDGSAAVGNTQNHLFFFFSEIICSTLSNSTPKFSKMEPNTLDLKFRKLPFVLLFGHDGFARVCWIGRLEIACGLCCSFRTILMFVADSILRCWCFLLCFGFCDMFGRVCYLDFEKERYVFQFWLWLLKDWCKFFVRLVPDEFLLVWLCVFGWWFSRFRPICVCPVTVVCRLLL